MTERLALASRVLYDQRILELKRRVDELERELADARTTALPSEFDGWKLTHVDVNDTPRYPGGWNIWATLHFECRKCSTRQHIDIKQIDECYNYVTVPERFVAADNDRDHHHIDLSKVDVGDLWCQAKGTCNPCGRDIGWHEGLTCPGGVPCPVPCPWPGFPGEARVLGPLG